MPGFTPPPCSNEKVKRLLREPLHWLRRKLLARPVAINASPDGTRRDEHRIEIQHGLAILVYWKVAPLGSGPAIILQTDKIELMKFDCFGGSAGHYHVAPWYGARIAFLETTIDQQIDRSIREIKQNAATYLNAHLRPEISSIVIDEPALVVALADAASRLKAFAQLPEIQRQNGN